MLECLDQLLSERSYFRIHQKMSQDRTHCSIRILHSSIILITGFCITHLSEEYSKNDECQYIIFEYNTEDSESEETKKLVNSFSKHFFIESEGRRLLNEYNKSFSKDIYPNETRAKAINTLFVKGEKLFENKEHKPVQISCISFEQKRIYIDQFGKIFACYNQAEYYPDSYIKFSVEPVSKNKLDFTSIKNFSYKDCLKCEKNIRKMIDILELDFVC